VLSLTLELNSPRFNPAPHQWGGVGQRVRMGVRVLMEVKPLLRI